MNKANIPVLYFGGLLILVALTAAQTPTSKVSSSRLLTSTGLYGCDVQPCLNHGTCHTEQESNLRKFKCSCAEGYTGDTCETDINECNDNPCQNSGTCINGPGNYTCICPNRYIDLRPLLGDNRLFLTGYNGTNCEHDINECDYDNPRICQAEGKCDNSPPGSFTCYCKSVAGQLHTGTLCEQLRSYCGIQPSSESCQNGGTCIDISLGYRCNCIPGFTDTFCQTDIDECASSPCQYNGTCDDRANGYVCTCIDGITGKNCETNIDDCIPNPCLHGGYCKDNINSFSCDCSDTGFNGKICDNNINDCVGITCQNGGTCVGGMKVNDYKCVCQPGWTGVHCEQDIDDCKSNPCLQGRCHDYINFYSCTCPTGFEGKNCDINIDDCNKTHQLCENGGDCFDGINDYSCSCTSEWMGKNCSEVYNACAFKPCLNGANCNTEQPHHNYTCACLSGFTGHNCQTNIDDCLSNSCPRYQTCYDGINSYSCGCPLGYTGDTCDEDINECDTNPCQNSGTCINGPGNYTCTCPNRYIDLRPLLGDKGLFLTGYTGTHCEHDINECAYDNPPICQAEGKCDNSPAGSFTCYCTSVAGQLHSGTFCEQVGSYCGIRPPSESCQNGGICIDIPLGYRCNCIPGFTGMFCETDIDECASFPCQYNGTCDDRVNGYVCTCIDGITGQNCETNIDDCTSNPCLHGGYCMDNINSFSCDCSDTGFNGTICDNNINDCLGITCQNGGTCKDGVKAYICDCLPGYTGSRCEIDIPECSPNPCAYNSKCLEYSNISLYDNGDPHFANFTYERAAGYLCVCIPGVKGVNCTEDIDECLSNPCQNNATCVNILKDGFSCSCLKGYEGHLCETEINECSLYRPCKNGGSCVDRLADYDCRCPTPVSSRSNYAGKNCTTYLSGCDGPRQCQNGNCIPKLINEVQNLHSFECDCYPGYTGIYCSESTDISFRGNLHGYIRSQINTSQFDLSLQFQTTLSSAVLVLWKLSNNAYVSVELNNGRVLLSYRTISNYQSCMLTTLSTVNNSAYHQLHLIITHNITLVLPLDSCTNTGCSTQNCQTSLTFTGGQPPPVSQLYIGSASMAGLNETLPASFTGCMKDVKINDDLYYPGRQIGQYFGVSPGCSRTQQCVKDSCSGHGFCEDRWDSYTCHCYRPFYGVNCEKV